VLVPSLLYGYGARHGKVGFVRAGAIVAVLGIVLNRLNVSIIAYNWNRPDHYVPSWMEVVVSLTLVTMGVAAFRWIANRMPILSEDARFAVEPDEGRAPEKDRAGLLSPLTERDREERTLPRAAAGR
jgi:hypothetical protein